MALKTYKPTTPAQRPLVLVDRSGLYKGKPLKTLTEGKTSTGGRMLNTDEDVCLALLEEQYVATVHGAAYHMSPFLRISTATADDELVEGLRRIQTFCEGLR